MILIKLSGFCVIKIDLSNLPHSLSKYRVYDNKGRVYKIDHILRTDNGSWNILLCKITVKTKESLGVFSSDILTLNFEYRWNGTISHYFSLLNCVPYLNKYVWHSWLAINNCDIKKIFSVLVIQYMWKKKIWIFFWYELKHFLY